MDEFVEWINEQLNIRGWSNNELARRMGVSNSAVYATMNGRNALTCEFCILLAKAMAIPPEDVLRRAGILSPIHDPSAIQELVEIAKSLKPDQREQLTDFARYLFTKK